MLFVNNVTYIFLYLTYDNILIVAIFAILQVAIIAGNFELAEYIKNHREADIGKQNICKCWKCYTF